MNTHTCMCVLVHVYSYSYTTSFFSAAYIGRSLQTLEQTHYEYVKVSFGTPASDSVVQYMCSYISFKGINYFAY